MAVLGGSLVEELQNEANFQQVYHIHILNCRDAGPGGYLFSP